MCKYCGLSIRAVFLKIRYADNFMRITGGILKELNPRLLPREFYYWYSLNYFQYKPFLDLLPLTPCKKKKQQQCLIPTSCSTGLSSKSKSGLRWLFRFLLRWFCHTETKGRRLGRTLVFGLL